jgi:hypothetical protein
MAEIRFSDVDVRNLQVAGRDMNIVYQLMERGRFLESLDRAHRTRRMFFALSALALIVTLVATTYAILELNDIVWSGARTYKQAFKNHDEIPVAIAVGAVAQVLTVVFFIMGLFSRSPRYR